MKTIKKFELRSRRIKLAEERAPYNKVLDVPEVAANIAMSLLEGEDQEVFLALLLNTKNRVLGYTEVARGGVDQCLVDPKVVFRDAIHLSASAVILIHNHPSGDPSPSGDDIALTKRLREVGDLVNVIVLDHIIVAGDCYRSLAASSHWK